MSKEYIVEKRILDSIQGELKVGTILDCDGLSLYLKNGKKAMELISVNGRKTAPYYREAVETEDF